jgi:hypothetical protein
MVTSIMVLSNMVLSNKVLSNKVLSTIGLFKLCADQFLDFFNVHILVLFISGVLLAHLPAYLHLKRWQKAYFCDRWGDAVAQWEERRENKLKPKDPNPSTH